MEYGDIFGFAPLADFDYANQNNVRCGRELVDAYPYIGTADTGYRLLGHILVFLIFCSHKRII